MTNILHLDMYYTEKLKCELQRLCFIIHYCIDIILSDLALLWTIFNFACLGMIKY